LKSQSLNEELLKWLHPAEPNPNFSLGRLKRSICTSGGVSIFTRFGDGPTWLAVWRFNVLVKKSPQKQKYGIQTSRNPELVLFSLISP
jgi:hypothetical protein